MIKKKKKLALFDLDDTLFDGDTEGEWVIFMHKNGFIENSSFFKEMEKFEKNYREGILNVYDYSEFLLSPLTGLHLSEIKEDINNFTSDISERLTDNLTEELLEQHKHDAKILTSGSLSFLVTEIGKKLGIKTCFGTDPEYIDKGLTDHLQKNSEYTDLKELPSGTEVEIFNYQLLQDINKCNINKDETEYLTYFITKNRSHFFAIFLTAICLLVVA